MQIEDMELTLRIYPVLGISFIIRYMGLMMGIVVLLNQSFALSPL
ncbi:unknown [Bacteroides sp. CAG:598]|nr:unknown [Bacteroides sp. CAG:598]